jgi:hypothetical protein
MVAPCMPRIRASVYLVCALPLVAARPRGTHQLAGRQLASGVASLPLAGAAPLRHPAGSAPSAPAVLSGKQICFNSPRSRSWLGHAGRIGVRMRPLRGLAEGFSAGIAGYLAVPLLPPTQGAGCLTSLVHPFYYLTR